jgi:hypothetical protein
MNPRILDLSAKREPGGENRPSLWQRTIQSQLEKHGFFLIRLHQRAPSFLVVRVGGDNLLCILNVLVDAA